MQVLYLQSEQVNGIHNLEDIHIQSSTSTAAVYVLNCMDTHIVITTAVVMWKDNRVESIQSTRPTPIDVGFATHNTHPRKSYEDRCIMKRQDN